MSEKYIQKGDYAILVEEKLTDGSFVYNVRVFPLPHADASGVELMAKDEATAQKLFNMIEETCVGISDC